MVESTACNVGERADARWGLKDLSSPNTTNEIPRQQGTMTCYTIYHPSDSRRALAYIFLQKIGRRSRHAQCVHEECNRWRRYYGVHMYVSFQNTPGRNYLQHLDVHNLHRCACSQRYHGMATDDRSEPCQILLTDDHGAEMEPLPQRYLHI